MLSEYTELLTSRQHSTRKETAHQCVCVCAATSHQSMILSSMEQNRASLFPACMHASAIMFQDVDISFLFLNILLLWWWSRRWLRGNRWCSHLHRRLLLHSLGWGWCHRRCLGVPKHWIEGHHGRSRSGRRLTSRRCRHCCSSGINCRGHWSRKRSWKSSTTRSRWLLLSSSGSTLHKSLQGDQSWVLCSKGHYE